MNMISFQPVPREHGAARGFGVRYSCLNHDSHPFEPSGLDLITQSSPAPLSSSVKWVDMGLRSSCGGSGLAAATHSERSRTRKMLTPGWPSS